MYLQTVFVLDLRQNKISEEGILQLINILPYKTVNLFTYAYLFIFLFSTTLSVLYLTNNKIVDILMLYNLIYIILTFVTRRHLLSLSLITIKFEIHVYNIWLTHYNMTQESLLSVELDFIVAETYLIILSSYLFQFYLFPFADTFHVESFQEIGTTSKGYII